VISRPVDRIIVNEVQKTYADLRIYQGDVVLDLGANIGAASRLFLDRGAAYVMAVEPDPSNVALLRRNLYDRPAIIFSAAVGPKAGHQAFHLHRTKPYLGSSISDRGRRTIRVPVVAFSDLLTRYQPHVVKCDIEFGEYQLDWTLPNFVHSVALEVHIRYDLVFSTRRQTDAQLREQRVAAAGLFHTLENQGFSLLSSRIKMAKDRPIEDETGLDPLAKSVDAIWSR
jgi:FkbM family methyltransferase